MKRLFLPVLLAASACQTDKDARPAPGPATYRVTFEATWSPATHSGAYPAGAHFSRLIGAAHAHSGSTGIGDDAYRALYRPGTVASAGIKDMAERGDNTALRSELEALARNQLVGLRFESRLGAIGSPGQFVDTVTVDAQHPLVTAVSMIAPSPDWFVALESPSLLDAAGQWQPHLSVPARAYDAGTDSGADFTSPDEPSFPVQLVRLISSGPLAPGGAATPLGTFHLERIR
ncbi:spondin domain-containing protein [Hymenobacter sp. 15J16-1T3B]|uniref:spondin domain-containing protein n=1 Tax=Hymenobacter sp. 15J16-1T3B TaxID=2886941 RepID=UPI001D12EB25|nr:spondin domain-containing protein [Hymenobacter sp. 15J16-1T3B]MCC3156384.1 spondin domain-containing protein [Hymenobacter sp. 15J16-1T3B]